MNQWVQVTAAEALAASRTIITNNVVFLGANRYHEGAFDQIPTIQSDTDYYYVG